MIYQNLTKNNDAIVPRRKIIYHFADAPIVTGKHYMYRDWETLYVS